MVVHSPIVNISCCMIQLSAGITLEWGTPYRRLLDEAAGLICAHWDEVGSFRPTFTLNPHHERYDATERAGLLHILTARDCGTIIGYFFMITAPSARDRTKLVAHDEVIYVKPAYRRYLIGPKMKAEAVEKARALGVSVVLFREKARRMNGQKSHLEDMGFALHELVYAKVLT